MKRLLGMAAIALMIFSGVYSEKDLTNTTSDKNTQPKSITGELPAKAAIIKKD